MKAMSMEDRDEKGKKPSTNIKHTLFEVPLRSGPSKTTFSLQDVFHTAGYNHTSNAQINSTSTNNLLQNGMLNLYSQYCKMF